MNSLATALGHLPLALRQAISYMKREKCTIEEYLDLFNSAHKKHLRDWDSRISVLEISLRPIGGTNSVASYAIVGRRNAESQAAAVSLLMAYTTCLQEAKACTKVRGIDQGYVA